ncbi:mucin-5AC, partial [Drosophila albomicans]|uniref:Mucin-5AC n=1 Tax=Drosophila albomicans TaxID=7291 RepID=A0A6P8XDQ5_DROAB
RQQQQEQPKTEQLATGNWQHIFLVYASVTMSLMKIHRSNESFWHGCGMLLLLLLLALLMVEATSTTTTTTTTTASETQTSATNGAIRQQQQQQTAEELVENVQQQQHQQQPHNESQVLSGNSAEILNPSDVDVVAEKPTTYRPAGGNRPSIAPHNSAQERERKLMNVLAARRSALHRGGFRTRIGTTGRSATSPAAAAVESTSKSPSDPRSVCIRNCTKNFTRRTTASCMRQCANFTRMAMANSNSSTVVLRSPSKPSPAAPGERDTNEILFSDESSHGLFVVAKEQNDTLNHIADGAKSAPGSKQRGRGKPAATVTLATTSLEQEEDEDEDELQPYLYFGAKLPPLKPGALTITAADGDNEHPRVLEVSVVQSTTTTPAPAVESTVKPTVSTRRPLTAVERSRSRYKYHMRERGVAAVAPPPAVAAAPPVSRTRYLGSGRPTAAQVESSVEQKPLESEPEVIKPVVVRRLASKPLASSTPLIITVLSAEEETTVAQALPEMQPEPVTERATSSSSTSTTTTSTTTTAATTSTSRKPSSTSSTTTTTTTQPTSTTTTSSTTTTPSTTTSTTTSTTPSTTRSTSTSTTTTTTTTPSSTTTTTASSTVKQKSIIEEDTEKLRALGPSLTQEINIEDQNNLIIFCNSTANCEATPRTQLSPTTDSSSNSKILRTTVLTSVRSTVNPRPTTAAPAPPSALPGNIFIGVVESSTSTPSDISSTAIADERDAKLDMRRMNLITLVLVAVGVVPLVAIVLYLVRNYMVRRQAKQDEVFDVCITDQQPISPVKKVDSKYQLELDEDEVDHHHQQAMPMSISQQQQQQQQPSRDANHNRYDDKTSLASEYQEFERSNIRLKSLLGEGNFGQVWKAEADDLSGHFGATRIVAVKTIRACSAQVSLKDEANIMRKLGSHQNVVTLLGACVESEPHMLIMEYAMRGRLLSLLRAARSATNILPASVPGGRSLAPLSPRTLAGFALDIACGMEYIAGRRIVHRDLAARNVLLDHNGMCKICDFGMSIDLDAERMRKEQEKNGANDILRSNAQKFKFDFGSRYILQHWQHTFGQPAAGNCSKDAAHSEKKSHGHDTIGKRHALPIRWMAPESLQFHMFTTETDIWAFGIVLWEIATLGSTPYSHLTGREVIRRVPQGLRPELPKESRHEFYNLMSRCWHKEPHMRPSFAQSRLEITRSLHKWVDDDSAASDYMDVSGFSEDLEHGVVYFNHRISEFECEI